ncbi:MAG: alpha/beta fold hydrolase [Pseudomonadota bacterium]
MAGCVTSTPGVSPLDAATHNPLLEDDGIRARDGAVLRVTTWAADEPEAIVIALHGMNDYANAFAGAAQWWAEHRRVTTYAYDQRGFGRSPDFGRWPGADRLKSDLRDVIHAVKEAHPELPLIVVGHSMGAAVVLAAAADASLPVDGAVLLAPAVWGASQLPLLYRVTARLSSLVAPGKTLTGERAKRQSTDNIPILRAMLADPLIIKETRIDAVSGLVSLMGQAYKGSGRSGGRLLVVYGERDEIIPPNSIEAAAEKLCGPVDVWRYPESWHLVLRDLQAKTVWRAVGNWIIATTEKERAASPAFSAVGPAAEVCDGA